MFAVIGITVVLGAVIGGYMLEHGNLSVLIQPADIVIIFGAAPQSALESARRAIPTEDRPSFAELEEAVKKWKESP